MTIRIAHNGSRHGTPRRDRIRAIGAGPALALLLALLSPADARAYQAMEGLFHAEAPCPATTSIRKGTNPDGARLEAGRDYRVHALNKPGGSHAEVTLPGAEPARRWVELICGRLTAAPRDDAATALRPFFDTAPPPAGAAVDPAPPAPPLTALDDAVLALCGPWGSRPSRAAFRRMLDTPALRQDLDRMRQAIALPPGMTEADFASYFTAAWFDADGFAHIFCGEPGAHGLGGLHYAPRYLQMQERGWGGIDPDCPRTEIAPPIYTIGVRYRRPDGIRARACPKGYALGLGAHELFVEAMSALRPVAGRPGKTVCLHRLAAPGTLPYLAVFVARDGAIRTFYPDASPACDGGGGPPASCLCGED